MPVYNEDKLAVLKKLMMEKAEAEKKSTLMEMERIRSERLEKVKDQALQDAYQMIQSQRGDINVQATASLSKKGMELHKQLIEQRDRYAQEVFDAVKEKLGAFASYESNSGKYWKYLEQALFLTEKTGLFAAGEAVIHVNPRDMKYEKAIRQAFSIPCKVKADTSVDIGGFIAENPAQGMILDETLDQKLSEQKEWFYKNSGFTVEAQF